MNPYYIYALKDPRTSPARPFYIGKGTGIRAWDHTLRVDSTRKGKRISEIQELGYEVVTTVLADDLTEAQALKLEAELISTFGTEDSGGLLTNSVIPSGLSLGKGKSVITPSGVVEKAQVGLELLKSAVVELAQANPEGITNSEASKVLGLQRVTMPVAPKTTWPGASWAYSCAKAKWFVAKRKSTESSFGNAPNQSFNPDPTATIC